ncbi:MAG: hypothetical protein WD059_14280 [Balneolaceae bacterium]
MTILFVFSFAHASHLFAQEFQTIYENLDNATSLYATSNSVYVVEQGNNRLLKLNHEGGLQETLGGNGSGDYHFSNPVDVDATNGLKIYITDYNNRRIQVYDRRGQFLTSISASQHFNRRRNFSPTQISIDNLGEIIFYDQSSNSILRIDEDADVMDEFRLPNDILQVNDLIATEQLIYILDREGGQIHVLSENGSYELFYPAQNVQAIFIAGEILWKSYADRIVIESRNAEDRTIEFGSNISVVDIQAFDEAIFILGENTLYKIQE